MSIQPSYDTPERINIDKIFIGRIFEDHPAIAQTMIAHALFQMLNKLTHVFKLLSKARSACNLAAIEAGFNSADETAASGKLIALGGLALGSAGVVQGIGNFKQAEGIAEATQIRNNKLEVLNEKFNTKEVTLEAIDDLFSHTFNNEDLVLEVEGDVFCDVKEALSKEQIKETNNLKQDKIDTFDNIEKNERTKLANKDYEVDVDFVKAKASRAQFIILGQGTQNIAQGLSEYQKSKSQKESLIQQTQQENQSQQGSTVDGIKRKIDKLSDFDPFQRNSSSYK